MVKHLNNALPSHDASVIERINFCEHTCRHSWNSFLAAVQDWWLLFQMTPCLNMPVPISICEQAFGLQHGIVFIYLQQVASSAAVREVWISVKILSYWISVMILSVTYPICVSRTCYPGGSGTDSPFHWKQREQLQACTITCRECRDHAPTWWGHTKQKWEAPNTCTSMQTRAASTNWCTHLALNHIFPRPKTWIEAGSPFFL